MERQTFEMEGRGKKGCGSIRRRFRLEDTDIGWGKLEARLCVGMALRADLPKKKNADIIFTIKKIRLG